jgi:hypothetical protein
MALLPEKKIDKSGKNLYNISRKCVEETRPAGKRQRTGEGASPGVFDPVSHFRAAREERDGRSRYRAERPN